MSDLKPCAYCENDDVTVCEHFSEYGATYHLQCRKCKLKTSDYISKEAAVKAWNEGKIGGFYKPITSKKEEDE